MHTIARTEINSQLDNAFANTSVITKIAHLGARHARFDLSGRLAIPQ